MGNPNKIIGQTFGRLTVLKIHHKKQRYNKKTGTKNGNEYFYLCQCTCGNLTVVSGILLRNSTTRSCGCLAHDVLMERNTKHNLTNSRIHTIWAGMKRRCYNKNDKCYKDYGKRGISVCSEWKKDFLSFYNWAISNGYSDNLSIDRIDNNGNYEPSNCKWSTNVEQANNRRTTSYIIHNNKKYTAHELSKMSKCSQEYITELIKRGHSFEDITSRIPTDKKVFITYNNETHHIAEWAKIKGIKYPTLKGRLRRGWSIERALST